MSDEETGMIGILQEREAEPRELEDPEPVESPDPPDDDAELDDRTSSPALAGPREPTEPVDADVFFHGTACGACGTTTEVEMLGDRPHGWVRVEGDSRTSLACSQRCLALVATGVGVESGLRDQPGGAEDMPTFATSGRPPGGTPD
jgi:hypothetical protein